MISAHIMGGLGNQLFIIFACISYAWENNTDFIFYDDQILHRSQSGSLRPTYWNNFLSALKRFTTTEALCFPRGREYWGHHYVKLPKIQQNITLEGYFQSYKYFQSYQDKIYKLIGIHEQRGKIKQLYPKYFHTRDVSDNIISLHFRLGDYKKLQQHHALQNDQYYIDALKKVMDKTGKVDWNVLYFCEAEDNEIVKNRIDGYKKIYPNIIFIKASDDICDWEQMLLMSCCDHHIIANSSFSWWGAYFNPSKEKIVCYPSVWFGPKLADKDVKDLFPDSWEQISKKE